MRLVVGLGNPGPEYAFTRHNAGWIVLDAAIARWGLGAPRVRFRGAFWDFTPIRGVRTAFLKPLTYMNLSGLSVREAVSYFRIEPSDLLVLFDDAALPFGRLRLRGKGSAGGQKGMVSILGALGTLEVPRLRIGVGAPPGGTDLADWVLRSLSKERRIELDRVCERAFDAIEGWLTEPLEQVMSRVNRSDRPE
jgi:PTH1 family peptidyl-tRNA hydrolase